MGLAAPSHVACYVQGCRLPRYVQGCGVEGVAGGCGKQRAVGVRRWRRGHVVWRRRWGHAAHSRNAKGGTLAGTRLVSLARHNVRCVPSAPSLAHDLSGMLARPSTPCQHTAHACLPPHTLCMPAPLAHTPVTRYSTRHSRPKPSKSSSSSYNHLPLGSPAVAACAAQAVLSLPQQARDST